MTCRYCGKELLTTGDFNGVCSNCKERINTDCGYILIKDNNDIITDLNSNYNEIKLIREEINFINEKIEVLKQNRKPLLQKRKILIEERDRLEQLLIKQKPNND
jgi:DNA-binding PadR family transcriptional regulator